MPQRWRYVDSHCCRSHVLLFLACYVQCPIVTYVLMAWWSTALSMCEIPIVLGKWNMHIIAPPFPILFLQLTCTENSGRNTGVATIRYIVSVFISVFQSNESILNCDFLCLFKLFCFLVTSCTKVSFFLSNTVFQTKTCSIILVILNIWQNSGI